MPDNLFEILRQRRSPFVYGDRRPASVDSFIVLSQRPMPFGGAGGGGYIAGILPGVVTVDGSPAARQLELRLRSHNRRVVAVTWSDPNSGTYRFDDLNPQEEYDLIARDHKRVYSDVIIPAIRPWPYIITLDLPPYFFGDVDWEGEIRGGEPPFTLVDPPVGISIEGNTLKISLEESVGQTQFTIQDGSGDTQTFLVNQYNAASQYIGYRLNITRSRGHTSLSELEFASYPGGPNLAREAPGYAIESLPPYSGAGHEKENAFDGIYDPQPGSVWAAGSSTSGWIGFIFNHPVPPITEVRIVPRAYINQWPIDFTIQRTKDGAIWEDCGTYTDVTTGWEDYVARPFEVID